MLFKYSNIQLNIETIINNESSDDSAFFLHGFTGGAADWVPVVSLLSKKYNYYLVDLVGHGKSDSPKEKYYYFIDSIVKQLKEIITSISNNKIVLVGYSMGGRIALNYALQIRSLLKGLILESATWGINEENLRKERILQDEKLAEFIDNNPIDKFIDYWMNKDLFNTQKRFSNEKLSQIRKHKLENNKTGLSNTLRCSGTGSMKPLYNNLKDIPVRTMLISGELDTRYTDINDQMVKLFTNAEHKIIKNAGHNTHFEEPNRFIDEINKFLLVI
jgi:2-succinyl-6-hydroxy-2,4-cyclohexadiene-1-carboxylate synthase